MVCRRGGSIKIRHLIGVKEIVRSLKTRSLEEANSRKWKAITKIKEELEKVASGSHLDAQAFEVAKDYEKHKETMEGNPDKPETADPYPGLDDLVGGIKKDQGEVAASRFYMIATSQGLLVDARSNNDAQRSRAKEQNGGYKD